MKHFTRTFYLCCTAILLSFLSCDSANQIKTNNENVVADTTVNVANEAIKTVESSFRINEEGWKIPDLTKCEIGEKNVKQNIKAPKPITLNTYRPKIDELLFKTSLGEMRVLGVREFEIEKRKFCYVIAVTQPSSKDPTISNVNSMTYVVYYDLDGDGKFEAKDMKGGWIPKHFPKWLDSN